MANRRTHDLRTRSGRETEVLDQVAIYRGFSVFWATENRNRAAAIARLEQRQVIDRLSQSQYPWCAYQLTATR